MDTYLQYLKEFISFKSISTDSAYKKELDKTASWLEALFTQNGFEAQVITGYGNPIVLAHFHIDKKLPTCLIYGHYDVQPADILEGWTSDPFTLRQDGKKLYGRGVVDNKGQILIHVVSIFERIKQKKLGMNIIFMIEGGEETGGTELTRFVKENKESVSADFVLISDGEMKGNNPTIEAGLRGGFNCTLTIKTGEKDLHSGIYGGIASNAAHTLSMIINKTVDSFPLSSKAHPSTNREVGLIPALDVTSIQAGYQGEGYRNSIPHKASAKINVRIVKSQDPHEIFSQLKEFIKTELPSTCTFEFTLDHPHNAVKLDLSNEYVKEASSILKKVYGKEPLFTYSGGAIPIVDEFNTTLKIPTLLVNLANEDCNMHGVDENFDIEFIEKGLAFSTLFFETTNK